MTVIISGSAGIQNVLGSAAAPAESNTTSSNTGMYFPTSTTLGFSTAGTNAVYIDASQNVGIGTTSPSTGTLNKQLTINSGASALAGVVLQNNTSGTSSSDGFAVYLNSTNAALINYEAGALSFGTSGAERARIDSGGNLLVGTTTTRDSLIVSAGGSGAYAYRSDAAATAGVYYHFTFNPAGGTQAGYIFSPNTSSTAYITTSDYRLKENVQPMIGALAKVAQLKPVTYKWKVDGIDGQGFIAHELQEVVPDCVAGIKDAVDADGNPIYQGIDTSFLVATLTAAIQEQQALITQLTDRIAALEAR